jgi:hypothetical protein
LERLKILSTPDGLPGKPVEIGEVPDSGLSFSQRRGQLGRGRLESPGCDELIRLLGEGTKLGYMERRFHLITGRRRLSNCSIVLHGGHIEFVYDAEHPAESDAL